MYADETELGVYSVGPDGRDDQAKIEYPLDHVSDALMDGSVAGDIVYSINR